MSKLHWHFSPQTAARAPHDISPPERSRASHGRLAAVLLIAALGACLEREISGPAEGSILPAAAKYWQAAKAVIAAPAR
jgi:hypothetical protein